MKQLTFLQKLGTALAGIDMVLVLLLIFFCVRSINAENAAVAGNSLNTEKASTEKAVGGKEISGKEISVDFGDTKKVALTFDDGPHYAYTKLLLDGLKERGVVATFFVTGEHAVLHPDLVKRMREEGHLVGNHTYSHMALKSNNRDAYKEELIRTSEILEEITGEDVIFMRPPYGSWDRSLEDELNLIPVLWSVDSLDWCSANPAGITECVVEAVKENDIILMHDYYETSVTAALEIVDELMEEGFVFVTVEEILFD